MSAYKAPLNEFIFILKHLVNYDAHAELPGYEEVGMEMVEAILPEAAKFFENIIAPTNLETDQQGTRLNDGEVEIAPVIKGLGAQMSQAGWTGLGGSKDYDGSGFPGVVDLAVQEMLQSANMSLSLLPLLTKGVIHALSLYGTDLQKQLFLTHLTKGSWSGTMNLTEPQAGSDLSTIKCKAVPNDDHYLITGQKIYITWGEHDQTENIIHLVLARLPDAPEGTQGISMFLVPKYLVNPDGSLGRRNDVKVAGIEKKLGIHGSPTCTMIYGDNGGAVGYLVGPENKGLMCMFSMMNNARLSVGHQGVAVGERAYQQAVSFAEQRLQGQSADAEGRSPIIHHPDVKRMLHTMRALTEGGRAMSFYTIAAEDRSKHRPLGHEDSLDLQIVEVMTPLVKGWCTEASMEITSLGVQVHGGMGFVEETGAAQYMRDARILPIYEGTNGIQALDFVGRKSLRDGGEALSKLINEMRLDCQKYSEMGGDLGQLLKLLRKTISQCQQALDHLLSSPGKASYVAFNQMMLFGNSVAYWLLTKLAFCALTQINNGSSERYLFQKISTAKFFASQILTRNASYLDGILNEVESFDEFSVEDFAR
ncbi:acyl-CoA dehydrogenase family protein [Gammaproteobacteria bacterium]|nr:acyl-CoA dehydrogenase family protein [Gammaproteobacteria bacterium]